MSLDNGLNSGSNGGFVRRRRDFRKIILAGVAAFVAVFLFVLLSRGVTEDEADAASLANFDPGYIISDYQMGNYNSMSEAEIQAWLSAKNSCPNTDYGLYTYLMGVYNGSVTWTWKNGHFACISDELFGDGEVIGSGETAAHIIWQAAQDYHINPQVLLVTLEKENSLISDTVPNSFNYRTAMGFGCPDTAACSSKYYGFKNQVRSAAALYSEVLNGGWTNYPLGDNWIRYGPTCGEGSVVNIRSLATSALYRYTPYQPSSAVLAAGYGSLGAGACNAYGNRNFYIFFQDWFGGVTDDYSEKLGRTMPDGTYQITSMTYGGKALDIYNGVSSETKQQKVILYSTKGPATGRTNQTFEVKYNTESGYYNIYNAVSGSYLTLDADGLEIVEKSGSCRQNWNLKRNGVGQYTMISACAGENLAALSDSTVGKATSGLSGQSWRFYEISGETNVLEDGTYQVLSALKSEMVIDIKGGVVGKTSGEINLWEKHDMVQGNVNQTFEVKYDGTTGYYTIINPASGMSLDVYGAGTNDGTSIIAWAKNGGCNQAWMIRKSSGGYEILSACSGKAIDVPQGRAQNGQELIIYTRQGNRNQMWNFDTVKEETRTDTSTEDAAKEGDFEGDYMIKTSRDAQMVLDIKGGVSKNSTSGEAIIYSKKSSGISNQVFRFKKDVATGTYYIYNPESNLYLDVANGGTTNDSRVILWTYNGGCNQRWEVKGADDGYYTFASACSGKVMDVYYGAIVRDQPIVIYTGHGGYNQKWGLERIK